MMGEEISLYEKCKIAVWMEQFQCAEVVQLRYKKEFSKDMPQLDWIKEIHHLFMTTGSVVGNPTYLQDENVKTKIKAEVNLKTTSDEDENFCNVKSEPHTRENSDEDDDDGPEIEMRPFSHEKVSNVKNENDFVSILNEEVAVEDQEYAEISVNECEDEMEDFTSLRKDTFSCIYCGYKTTNKTAFEAHQKAHKVKDFFRCSLCTFTSNSTSSFRSHKKSCTRNDISHSTNIGNKLNVVFDPKCHTCEQCGKAYSSAAALKMHQAYHSKLRPFACDKCDYRFFSETTLNKHLSTHDKIKHLECPHCSFKSSMSGNMIIHARTHTGEKPYKCTECDYRTANPNVLRRHLGSHRNELLYRCRKCTYKTDKSSLFANHEKKHESGLQFQCHICQKQLKNSYALRYHLTKKHSDQEVLECPFCDFRQRDKALLKMHIRRHTGEKPYACRENNCDYRAMRSQDMKKHLAKAHR